VGVHRCWAGGSRRVPFMHKKTKKEKQAARKQADDLVAVGNGHLDRAMASRRAQNLIVALDAISHAEGAYQQAAATVSSVHLDSAYNLGVCAAMRANIASRQRKRAENNAARGIALRQFQYVIEADTSGRSETLALAHASLAALVVEGLPAPETGGNTRAEDALSGLDEAVSHINIAIAIRNNLGDPANVALLHLQAGDTHAAGMRWCFDVSNIDGAFYRCEAACRHYDEGLRSPVPVDDLQLLEQKAKCLHGLCTWSVEKSIEGIDENMRIRVNTAINVANETAKAIVALAPSTSGKEIAELLVVCGDICEMGGNLKEAMQLYERAVGMGPIADGFAGMAELLLDEGRMQLSGANESSATSGAVEILRRSSEASQKAAQLDPRQKGCYIYNVACATALVNDQNLCSGALGELQAMRLLGGEVGAEATKLLTDMAHDADFDRVRDMPWFVSRV